MPNTLAEHRQQLASMRQQDSPGKPKITPTRIKDAKVLMVLNSGVDDAWLKIRGDFPCDRIRQIGHSAAWIQDKRQIAACIENAGTRVVINRAFAVDAGLTESLANRYPHVKFVSCCHSSQSYLMYGTAGSLKNQNYFMKLARDYDNCYYATVDERNLPEISDVPRCIVIPNTVKDPPSQHGMPRAGRTVSLIGRADMIKNWPNQIIAVAKQHRWKPLRLLMMIRGNNAPLIEMAKLFRIPLDVRPWSTWEAYMRIVDQEVNVGMQVSFSESFNYVALEHMLCGVPVLGSHALRYLPNDCYAPCDDPEAMSQMLGRMLDHYNLESRRAREHAAKCMQYMNEGFDRAIHELLGD